MNEPEVKPMSEKEIVLSEVKTLVRILNRYGNALVPSLNGKETFAIDRLKHFVGRAESEFGMSMDDVQKAIM